MIIDMLENSHLYLPINNKFRKAFDFIRNKDLMNLEPGKYEIYGLNIYGVVNNYFTKPKKEGLWEAHHHYIDIQYVITNKELIGYTNLSQVEKYKVYDENKDIEFFTGKGSHLIVNAGTFVIFYPHEVHMPGIALENPEKVKKVVIKVLLE
ncbi:MAG: YhcH/YjgK/YiaL family protein [Atribacterota bacterium]|jgi:YhcH/YjgK/YiaL family protein|nr:YhcH/YjgK/YiaL family protein [Atribacterota bacterium]MDD4896887.1 YhcH/YjgK/YiaL family protein [Atribacterota bacterium]MDD5637738.1 YhcH/YjgK/YiaL family protein [Atribacterota bacterium]